MSSESSSRGIPPRQVSVTRVWAALAIAAGLLGLAGTYPVVQHGMNGTYFRRSDWTGEQATRIDPVPSLIGAELAIGPVVPPVFSAYWTATLAVDRAGTYQLDCTSNAWCRAIVQEQLIFDSHDPSARRNVTLAPGVYPVLLQASATTGRMDIDFWWQQAGEPRRRLQWDVVFPGPMTLGRFRRLAAVARLQRWILAAAGALMLLLAVDWARRQGTIGWVMLVTAVAAGVAVHADWPPDIRGPSGGEWQWPYRAGPFDRSLFAAVAAGVTILAGVAFAGTSAARRRPRLTAAVLIAGGVVAGLGFRLALLDTEPGGWQQTIVDRIWTGIGYLRSAALTADTSIPDLLARYPSIMSTLPLHATTHPPGPTLWYRMLAWTSRSSGLANADLVFAFGSAYVPGALPLAHVALAGGLMLMASGALTAVPVSLAVWVVRRDPLRAAAVGLLWAFCPGATIFSPALEQLCALLVASAFALLLYAQQGTRGHMLAALASGAIAGGSLFVSYGTAPMLAAVVVMCAYRIDEPGVRRVYGRTILTWMIGCAAATFAPMMFGFPVIATAMTGLRLHKEFTATRSAAVWLGANLVDFAMFLGAASLVVAVAQASALVENQRPKPCVEWRLTAIACCAILLVDLSGATRGEVGRLWMPFMPLLFAAIWSAPDGPGSSRSLQLMRPLDGVVVGALSMLYCISLRLHWFIWY